mmetsp:Transcript_17117/g.38672  ORF Transcript_17117/g.38672 Transcript_17117/m.38672 type:complete len:264 (+) Transcript_17117:66-857(+)
MWQRIGLGRLALASTCRRLPQVKASFRPLCAANGPKGCGGAKEPTMWAHLRSLVDSKELNTIPNIITISRIIASPGLSIAIAYDMKMVALGGCVLFGFSDWLDGYLAQRLNQRTVLGAFLDPMADKVMIGAIAAGLVAKGLMPLQLAAVIISRDMLLVGCVFAMRAKDRPAGAPFFDTTSSATFDIVPSDLSKINTGVQFTLLGATLCHFAFGSPSMELVEPLWWITAYTTISSGLLYLGGTGTGKIKRAAEKVQVQKVKSLS